ncbi:Aldehyde dehydrogenase [Nesidiocoris tenuis]|uniref:Aldehyde dehydrogenase n=1 Tax=Nesidiocoris tenuis TaxID=355587 RepID=A0ABN7AJ99_9HEMI|nr:Aldehyde dehydrogenase [Nesidiocoris tenuis]
MHNEGYTSSYPTIPQSLDNDNSLSAKGTPELSSIVVLSEIVEKVRKAFRSGITQPYEFRLSQLKQLHKLCKERGEELAAALSIDLRKGDFESYVCEIELIKAETEHAMRNLKTWMKPEKAGRTTTSIMDTVQTVADPYGVALIISSWNYPVHLTLMPLVGAIAAGNCVIIKPSEMAPATSETLNKLIPQYLHQACYKVVQVGPKETEVLLSEKFDYVFYTGSSRVGQLVYSAASKHLTPVTLEMGGKSPVFLDDTCDLRLATERILWGKLVNAGQTCIAPDYVLCSQNVQSRFVEMAKEVINKFYPNGPRSSPDLCRIINEKHFRRLRELLGDSEIAIGGEVDENERYVSPTVLTNVKETSKIMQEEIFGPILPVICVDSPNEALNFIMERSPPLTCYVFSTRRDVQDAFVRGVTAGSICINETCSIIIVNSLPFGGVGSSGIGAYHGKYSFDTFSHKKSILIKDYNYITDSVIRLRYPPYTQLKRQLISMAIGLPLPGIPWRFIIFCIGVFIGVFVVILLQKYAYD